MSKFIIELQDIRETPRSKPKLNIEIKMEPAKRDPDSKAQELGYELIDFIDEYRRRNSGGIDKMKLERY